MNPVRVRRLQSLFEEAADLPSSEQETFLRTACGDDTELMTELLSMLEADIRADCLLDQGLPQLADDVLHGSGTFDTEGAVLGPYRLEKVIGEGGMGVVYLAKREDLQSTVAVKVLRDAWLSPVRRLRFTGEQRVLAQLSHPSIARFYDAGITRDGTPYFVMEYVDGLPITEFCRWNNSSPAQRLHLFRAVCEAVQFAHQHAVIHRDLKPSNILVKADGSVRLLDFGIAKQLDSLAAPADLTRTEMRMMTPAYAAPEQLRGEAAGLYTDVYALGLILYELLTEVPAHTHSTHSAEELKQIILEGSLEPPSASRCHPGGLAGVSKASWSDLDTLCLTAAHRDIAKRYPSAEALIRDIDHYFKGEPLEARRDSVLYRARKFVQRNAQPLLATVLLLLALAALSAFFTHRLIAARNATLAASDRTQRVQQFMLNLFEGGNSSAAPSEDLRVLTFIDRGVQQAQALAREPEFQAELYQTLGRVYQKLDKFDQADKLLRLALEGRRNLFGPDHPEVTRSLTALGLLRLDQAHFDEAEQLIRRGLNLARHTRPYQEPLVAESLAALGKAKLVRGQYKQAVPLLQEAVQLNSRLGLSEAEQANTSKDLVDAHFYLGHYDVCDKLLPRILAVHRKYYGERHAFVADDLIDLGAVQEERGNYPQAEQFYRQALSIDEDWFGKTHPEAAAARYMLGKVLVMQDRFDEAEKDLLQAFAIRQHAYGARHPRTANPLNELCTIASQRNLLDRAEACFLEVTGIYRTGYGDNHYLVALGLSNLATVYLDQKRYTRAEDIFREVLTRYARVLPPDHIYIAIAQVKLGRTLLREGRFAEAQRYTLAGYQTISRQANPSISWLHSARKDLISIYNATGEPAKAAEVRAELARTEHPDSPATHPR